LNKKVAEEAGVAPAHQLDHLLRPRVDRPSWKAAKMDFMSRVFRIALIALAAFAVLTWWSGHREAAPGGPAATAAPAAGYPSFLPHEAVATLQAIERGGPFPYPRDGVVFQNRERLLPERPRGYYHEYTVPTPGEDDRGARRLVTGGDPPEVYYYSDDHYRSFRKVEITR
jgi:ribonuclease T1